MYKQEFNNILRYLDQHTKRYGQWFGAKTVFGECGIPLTEIDFMVEAMRVDGHIVISKNPAEYCNITLTAQGKRFIKSQDEDNLRRAVIKGLKETRPKAQRKFPWANFWTAVGSLAAVAAAILAYLAITK